MEAPLDPDIVTHAMKVERTAAQGNEPQAYTPATELKSLKPWTMLALAALAAVIISLWTWHWQMSMTAILLVSLTLGPLLRWWTLHRATLKRKALQQMLAEAEADETEARLAHLEIGQQPRL